MLGLHCCMGFSLVAGFSLQWLFSLQSTDSRAQTGRGSGSVGGAQRARRGSAACMRGGLSELVRHQQDWAPWRAHLDGDGAQVAIVAVQLGVFI